MSANYQITENGIAAGRWIIYQKVGRGEKAVWQGDHWQEANRQSNFILLDEPAAQTRIADRMEMQMEFDRMLERL